MPVPGFLTSIADKTQNALKDSPLSQHLPSSLTGAPKPADSGSTQKNVTFGQIQHQFRQLQQNYTTTGPVQKIITAEKGVTLDLESLSRDVQAQSKELYMWGQHEEPDVKDVSDRLGFLNYIFGSLSGTLAGKLDTARAPLKELRANDVALTQKRNVRAGLQNQIGHLEHSQEKGTEKRIAELKEQLAKAEKDDEPLEKEHMILVRKALRESEQLKFNALREYGEKLSLLSQAADAVLAVLPSVPPSAERPYAGTEETGTIRASLQHSVDQWKPGQVTLAVPAGANLDRTHTGSFGETHVEELKQIKTDERPPEPASPPLGGSLQQERDSSLDAKSSTTPAPAPAPEPAPAPVPTQASGSTTIPSATSAGDSPVPVPTQDSRSNTNPATTSVQDSPVPVQNQDLSSATNPSTTTSKDSPVVPATEPSQPEPNQPAPILSTSSSAAVPVASPEPIGTDSKVPFGTPSVTETGESSSSAAPKRYESAEEEKKRLEREEREKILQGKRPGYSESEETYEEGDTPPPYQDI